MKTTYWMTIAASLALALPAFSQSEDVGRCGQPRGTCGNECNGEGYLNQQRGKGNGKGQGYRRGPRDGSGNGAGKQERQRKRDGSGPGRNR